MSGIKDGGPAFPSQELNHDGSPYYLNQGMTLRDYFAAKAMESEMRINPAGSHKTVASMAYAMADEMLKAREVQP